MSAKFALIIANTKYTDPGLAQLSSPGRDAEEFARVLKSKDICDFQDVNVLLNKPYEVVREEIDKFFDQKKSDDLLILYFSGHGIRDELGVLYLATINTHHNRLRSTAIKSDFIREAMDQSRSKRQVLILDCSNSGAFARGSKYATGESMGTASAFEGIGYGRVVMTATDSTQFAWEGDRFIGQIENSLFTHFLVKGLEGEADLDGDGKISVDELYDYAYEQIIRLTPKQTPGKWSYKQQGEIILRESIRIENINPASLPKALISEIEDAHPYVRQVAVQKLEKLLKGNNIGLARSAREALEKIASEDDTRRVGQMAMQVLESIRRAEKDEEKKAREEADRLTPDKVNAEKQANRDDIQRLIQYANAKVVLVGDTGVGKSGLALVLTNQPFAPTESTHGRRVLRFENKEVELTNGLKEIQETILWDLAGQPGYRLIHQLDLQDVDVAIIVFDARSEANPVLGIAHWIKALQQNEKARGEIGPSIKKFLVAARTDRGQVSLGHEYVSQLAQKYGLNGYFETSAKEGWNIPQLSDAIRLAINWDSMLKVSSNALFENIKNFLNGEKLAHRILSTLDDLYRAFISMQKGIEPYDDLRAQFNICINRVESLGLIRSLSFGNLVLLQPEILVSYASALINAVKSDLDGLGSISEENVRNGQFFVPREESIRDKEQEKLLLIAMVEDLLKHEIALREGVDLVFPTQLTRESPELSDPEGKSVIFRFEGAVLNIYVTLVVRLSHSGLFVKKELWKNAATFRSRTRGTCGIFLIDHEDGRGELKLFYDNAASEETCLQFEEYIHVHIERLAISGTVKRERIFVCDECKTPITNLQVVRRRELGFNWLKCGVCEKPISLLDGDERLSVKPESRVDEIDEFADAGRRQAINTSILQGKIATNDFDVFLCHNSQDKSAIKKIGEQLKSNGILPWLDEWELRPGLPWQRLLEEQIFKIKAAAVFVGPNGVGPWQRNELDAFLRAFVDRGCPVIPVLLPTTPKVPELPIFLQSMTWVDFRRQDPEPLERLIWGITGERITA